MAKKQSKRQTKSAAPAAEGVLDVNVPEKRTKNFFARIKASNKDWFAQEAKRRKLNSSEYLDLICDKFRAQQANP